MHGSKEGCFGGFDGVMLVVRGGCWAGEVINTVYLKHKWFTDIVADEFEIGIS